MSTANSTGWAGAVNAGKARLLVTWGAQRTKNWPNVPTLKEIGIDMVSNSPFGIAGPKGMDPAVVKVLHDAFKKGMEEQSYKDAMAKLDQEDYYLNTADYQAYAMQQIGEQKQLVEELGLTAAVIQVYSARNGRVSNRLDRGIDRELAVDHRRDRGRDRHLDIFLVRKLDQRHAVNAPSASLPPAAAFAERDAERKIARLRRRAGEDEVAEARRVR